MTEKKLIENFLSISKIAVVGVSRNDKKFGNVVYRELKKKDYKVFAVNPTMDSFDDGPCYPNLDALPEAVGGVVLVVSPKVTEKMVVDVHQAGIKQIWMQQGSQSEKAIQYCKENGINIIHNECILMFAEPVTSVHKFHRWMWKIFGKLPK